MRRVRVRIVLMVAVATTSLVLAVPAGADDGEGEGAEPSGSGSAEIAAALASEFGLTPEEISDLQEAGVGWGGIFKLGMLSIATGEDPAALLASALFGEEGEFEFAWGEWFKGLEEEQWAALGGVARNLGQAISADKRGHGRPEHAVGAGEKPEHPGKGKGPKAGLPAQSKRPAGT